MHEQINDWQNSRGVEREQSDEPILVLRLRALPECHSFPHQFPHQKCEEEGHEHRIVTDSNEIHSERVKLVTVLHLHRKEN